MLVPTRRDLAANLAAYGETEASARIESISAADFKRVCELGYRHALDGAHFSKASSLAAIEVIEGRARNLRRAKRSWTDVPASPLAPDPAMAEIEAWVAKYAGGEPVRKAEIMDAISTAMSKAFPQFRYFKTAQQFRQKFAGGMAFIGVDYARSTVALRFGLRIDSVERIKAQAFGVHSPADDPHPRTISKYSYNMGPKSPFWPYPTETTWPVSGSDGLQLAAAEIVEFADEAVLPYLSRHEDPMAIRDTFLNNPGYADNAFSNDEAVFAIDMLSRRRDWLDSDLKLFESRYASYAQSIRDELPKNYARAIAHWDDGD